MNHRAVLLPVAFGLFAASSAFAVTPPPPFALSVTPTASYAFDADLDGGASLSVARAGVNVTPAFMIGQAVRVSLNSNAEYSRYEFDKLQNFEGVAGSVGNVPDDTVQVVLRPSVAVFFSEDFAVFGGPVFTFGGEPDVDIGDSVTYGGFAGFNYQISPGVWIGTGIAFTQELASDGLVLPLVNVAWQINDQLRFDATGLSARLSYAVTPEFTIYAAGAYEFREFRLGEASIVSGGVLSDESIPVTLGVDWKVNSNLTLGVFGGVVAWRQVEFFNDTDNSIADDNSAVTPYGGIKAELAF